MTQPFEIKEGALPNHAEIIQEAEKSNDWKDRLKIHPHETNCGTSKLHTLLEQDMSESLLDEIFRHIPDKNLRTHHNFVQIQKYEVGDYMLPHMDSFGCIRFHLFVLTSSKLNGLTLQTPDDGYVFIPDKAGSYISFDNHALWHWVNPVREKTRYTLVIGE